MRRVLTPAHATFSAANRTISFATTVPASISHILKVTNLTRGEVLFDPTAESGLGYLSSATYASPVLTLGVSTAGMADNDRLFIEYDDGQGLVDVQITGPVDIGSEVEIKNDSGNPVPTEPLGRVGVARQLAAGSASANTALTTTCRRVSMRAVGADIRYAIGSSSQTASGTSHLIANGERLDVAVPETPNIAVIRAGSTNGTLEVSELI